LKLKDLGVDHGRHREKGGKSWNPPKAANFPQCDKSDDQDEREAYKREYKWQNDYQHARERFLVSTISV
jgi:hypothetical protein